MGKQGIKIYALPLNYMKNKILERLSVYLLFVAGKEQERDPAFLVGKLFKN